MITHHCHGPIDPAAVPFFFVAILLVGLFLFGQIMEILLLEFGYDLEKTRWFGKSRAIAMTIVFICMAIGIIVDIVR